MGRGADEMRAAASPRPWTGWGVRLRVAVARAGGATGRGVSASTVRERWADADALVELPLDEFSQHELVLLSTGSLETELRALRTGIAALYSAPRAAFATALSLWTRGCRVNPSDDVVVDRRSRRGRSNGLLGAFEEANQSPGNGPPRRAPNLSDSLAAEAKALLFDEMEIFRRDPADSVATGFKR